MPEPTHEERAGARAHKATQDDDPTDRRKYRRAYVRKSGKVGDAVNNISTMVQEGIGVTKPTGQHALEPRGDQATQAGQPGPAVPDLAMGLAAGVAVVAEGFRMARNRRRKRRRRRGNT
jgi:hypothetical protein